MNLTLSFSLKASEISTCSVSSLIAAGEIIDDDDEEVGALDVFCCFGSSCSCIGGDGSEGAMSKGKVGVVEKISTVSEICWLPVSFSSSSFDVVVAIFSVFVIVAAFALSSVDSYHTANKGNILNNWFLFGASEKYIKLNKHVYPQIIFTA